MDADEINALNPEAFEQVLYDKWAVDRRDIYAGGVAAPWVLDAAQPMRPPEVIKRLKISQAILVGILATGDLPRPGKLTRGHVAWRKDEVESLVPLRER
jgi:predicted DNA-binding transcriptional regulator AlpA